MRVGGGGVIVQKYARKLLVCVCLRALMLIVPFFDSAFVLHQCLIRDHHLFTKTFHSREDKNGDGQPFVKFSLEI